MKVTFLGTGAMLPTKDRNTNAILISYRNNGILIDCGEGTQKQLRLANISPTKITKLLITHWHGDHVLGIPGLIQSLGASNYNKTLEIYGPKGTKTYLSNLLKGLLFRNRIDFNVKEVSKGIFFQDEDFYLEAFPLKHSITCLGYNFVEKDKRNVDVKYTKKFGLVQHPLLGKLQKGKDITYKGKKIRVKDATKLKKGKKISLIIDTYYNKSLGKFAANADLLISEATWMKGDEISKKEHLNSEEAARIAKNAKVGKLILTHFSQRYKNTNELKKQAKRIFKNTDTAKDFMEIKI